MTLPVWLAINSSASSSFRRRCDVRTSISNRSQPLDLLCRLKILNLDRLTLELNLVCHRSFHIAQVRYPRRGPPYSFSDFEFDTDILISAVDPKNTGILTRWSTSDEAIRAVTRGHTWTCWRLMINRDWLAVVPSLALALVGEPVSPYPYMSFGNLLNRKHHALRKLSSAEIRETTELRKYFLAVDGDRVSYGLIGIECDLRIRAGVCSRPRYVPGNSPAVRCL